MRKGIYTLTGSDNNSCDGEAQIYQEIEKGDIIHKIIRAAYASDSYGNVGAATTISYRHLLCKDQVNFNCIKMFKSHLQQLQLIKCVKTIVNGIVFTIYCYHHNLGLSNHNYDQIMLLVSDQSSYACCLLF